MALIPIGNNAYLDPITGKMHAFGDIPQVEQPPVGNPGPSGSPGFPQLPGMAGPPGWDFRSPVSRLTDRFPATPVVEPPKTDITPPGGLPLLPFMDNHLLADQPSAPQAPPPAPMPPPPPSPAPTALPFQGPAPQPQEAMPQPPEPRRDMAAQGAPPVPAVAPPLPATTPGPQVPTNLIQPAPFYPPVAGEVQTSAPVTPPNRISAAIFAQESGSGSNPQTSINGARGGMQIMPGTFAQWAKPGESIDNPVDNKNVGDRMIASYHKDYGGDAARVAVAYFSGPGNVAPPGSATPWKVDRADGNGKTVSAYVADIGKRLGDPNLAVSPGAAPPSADTGGQRAGAQGAPPSLPGMGAASFDPSQFQSSFGEKMLALGSGMLGGGTFSESLGRGGAAVGKLAATDRENLMKGQHLVNDTARQNASAQYQSGRLQDAQRRSDIAAQNSDILGRRATIAETTAQTAQDALRARTERDAERARAAATAYNTPAGRVTARQSAIDLSKDISPQIIAEGAAAVPNINAIIKTIDEGNWATSSWYDEARKFVTRATGMNILGMDPDQIDINDKQVKELSTQLAVATGIRIMSGRELQMITKGFADIGTNPQATKVMVTEKRDAIEARRERAAAWNALEPEERARWESQPGLGYGTWARGWMLQKGNQPHDSTTPVTTTGPDGKPRAVPSRYTMEQDASGRTLFTPSGGGPAITIR